MSERDGVVSETSSASPSCCLILTPKILLESLKIFLRNKRAFLAIFALTALPLSVLLFAVALSSHRLRSRVARLESLARLAPTRFEARHVWKESRDDAVSLLYSKALFSLPCLALSLLAAVSAVSSASLAAAHKRPTIRAAAAAVRQAWKRPLVTSILVHALLLAYVHVPKTLAAMFPAPAPRLLILAAGSALEVYLMAVMSLAIVVSIAEDRFGVGAIRAGWSLMEGRRATGWALSGLFALATGLIANDLERAMDGRDLFETPPPSSSSSAAETAVRVAAGIGDKFWLVVLYGFLVLWGYVVFTVFYCDCSSKRNMSCRGESEMLPVTV